MSARRLRVQWFDEWHADLDAALRLLPEIDTCPHDLYRELVENRGPVRRRNALVTARGEPIAVIGLRQDGLRWTPVTSWVVPAAVFPVRRGDMVDALAALREPVFVPWWRQAELPPEPRRLDEVESFQVRRLTCVGDYEAYWKESGLLSELKKIRRRCAHLTTTVNQSGMAEWTLRNWGRKWASPGTEEVPDTSDRLVVARYWESRGRHVTLALLDGTKPAAGQVLFVHESEVVCVVNYRVPEYDRLSVGNRLLDATLQWAASGGFQKVDFGSGHDHDKRRWAPVDGERWQFTVNPRHLDLATVQSAVWRRIRAGLGRLAGRG